MWEKYLRIHLYTEWNEEHDFHPKVPVLHSYTTHLSREGSKNINATPAVLFQQHLLIHSIYKIHIDKDNWTGTREIWFGVRKSIQCDFVKGLLQANKKSLSNKVHKEMFYEPALFVAATQCSAIQKNLAQKKGVGVACYSYTAVCWYTESCTGGTKQRL